MKHFYLSELRKESTPDRKKEKQQKFPAQRQPLVVLNCSSLRSLVTSISCHHCQHFDHLATDVSYQHEGKRFVVVVTLREEQTYRFVWIEVH